MRVRPAERIARAVGIEMPAEAVVAERDGQRAFALGRQPGLGSGGTRCGQEESGQGQRASGTSSPQGAFRLCSPFCAISMRSSISARMSIFRPGASATQWKSFSVAWRAAVEG